MNSGTFTHRINYQMKGCDVCYGNEKWKGSRKKLKDRWLHIYRSWIVKDYGDRSHDWGLSQDRWKSTSWSWSMVHVEETPRNVMNSRSNLRDLQNDRWGSVNYALKSPRSMFKWINGSRTHSYNKFIFFFFLLSAFSTFFSSPLLSFFSQSLPWLPLFFFLSM